MTKRESCVYYLFKDTFSPEWISKASCGTLLGLEELLTRLLNLVRARLDQFD